MKTVCVFIPNGKSLHALAESCYRLTPQIAIRESGDEASAQGGAIFLEIDSCRRLYKQETILLKVQALLKRFGVRASIALAHDVCVSLYLARLAAAVPRSKSFSSENFQPAELPITALYDFASPFAWDEDRAKQAGHIIMMLDKLGITTLGDFLKLPRPSLLSRFGDLGLELHRRVSHACVQTGGENHVALDFASVTWPPFVPPEKIEECVQLDDYENCQQLEPLLFLIKNLASRAMARLAGRSERVTRFDLELELEKHSLVKQARRVWNFTLPLPQGSVTGLLPLIQERLQTDFQRQPLESWVTRMRLEIIETVPGRYGQKNFFNKKEEDEEAWNSLLARLCQKLGKEHTFVASSVESYKPEKGWKKTTRELAVPPEPAAPEPAALAPGVEILAGIELPFPQRPLRILKAPVPLFKVHNALAVAPRTTASRDDDAVYTSNRWEIRDWDGPERLQAEWWTGSGIQRDYFRVGAMNGEQLWVFRVPDSDKLFLHGYFD